MENPGSYWTLLAVVGGPLVLGLAFAYAQLRRRNHARTEGERQATRDNWGKEVQR